MAALTVIQSEAMAFTPNGCLGMRLVDEPSLKRSIKAGPTVIQSKGFHPKARPGVLLV